MRYKYLETWMVDKYILSLPIECLKLDLLKKEENEMEDIRLWELRGMEKYISPFRESNEYKYYPYMVTPQDLSFAMFYCSLCQNGSIPDPEQQNKGIEQMYRDWNYPNLRGEQGDFFKCIKADKINFNSKKSDHYYIATNNDEDKHYRKLKVGVGNIRINQKDFVTTLVEQPNRKAERYLKIAELLNSALKAGVKLLVLPECCLPVCWIREVARWSATNQMALVTGVEHVVISKDDKKKAHNLVAVILPYKHEDYKYSHVVYREKVHYGPKEKKTLAGYNCEFGEGNSYHLFQWNDVWFTVYCCFELASIQARCGFKSLVDLVIVVEWNKDIAYFGSIIESMCRDLHCFCIQANSSDFGDSRVMRPSKREVRDIIKTKGGDNCSILAGSINIGDLRDFQRKGYGLQKESGAFKPTPPDYDTENVERKIRGRLGDHLEASSAKRRAE